MGHSIVRVLFVFVVFFVALPLSHAPAVGTQIDVSLAERVAALEEFRLQQRDWNGWMDRRISTDVVTSQGAQDARVGALEDKLNTVAARQMVVYAFGGLGSLILIVGAPIAWSAYSRNHEQIVRYQERLERMYRAAGYGMLQSDEREEEEPWPRS